MVEGGGRGQRTVERLGRLEIRSLPPSVWREGTGGGDRGTDEQTDELIGYGLYPTKEVRELISRFVPATSLEKISIFICRGLVK